MSHLEATASPLTLVFVIILTPTRGRSRTTTATRFGHGCCCINHIKEEKHTYMRTPEVYAAKAACSDIACLSPPEAVRSWVVSNGFLS